MKLLTVQDFSCYGKCSASIALPVLSAMGIETTVLPTALLSTHTGFTGFTFQDLTDQLPAIARHWRDLHLTFDAIYVGYLGSQAQLDFVLSLFDAYPQALKAVDPVMGDNGRLYSRITPDFAATMAALCQRANLILPNVTEACALLSQSYPPTDAASLVRNLRAQGANNVVLTGLAGEHHDVGALCLDASGEQASYFRPRIAGHYHGTGDLFASVCIGGLLRGLSLEHSLHLAVDFTCRCIENTQDGQENHWDGLRFETCLPWLMKQLDIV